MNAPAIWFTGEPGAGKTTAAGSLAALCAAASIPNALFDGDTIRAQRVRAGRPVGWDEAARMEHALNVAHQMNEARAIGNKRKTLKAVDI